MIRLAFRCFTGNGLDSFLRAAFGTLLVAPAFSMLIATAALAEDKPAAEQPAATQKKAAADTKAADEKPADSKAEKADDKADAKKPERKLELPVATEETEDPAVAWKKALDRRLEIFNQLQSLKKDFDKTTDKTAQRNIRDAYMDLIREFDSEVYPQMIKLAAGIYEKTPTDLDAAEIVLRNAFNENQFDKAATIGEQLLKADRLSKDVLNMTAIAYFAEHDFVRSQAIFDQAKKLNRINPRYDSYADAAVRYGDLWKKEQEIRAKEEALEGDKALPRVQFETDKGRIVFELFEDEAPNTVANFVSLIEGGKYNGIAFHRVIPAFMAQGGDPNTLNDNPNDDGLGGPGYTIACECYEPNARMHFSGSLSMAHAGKDSGGSQFFITHLPTDWLNPHTDPVPGGHTVFGRTIEGLDVARSLRQGDHIKTATVIRKRPHDYKPKTTAKDEPAAEPEKKEDAAKKMDETEKKSDDAAAKKTDDKPADEKPASEDKKPESDAKATDEK